MHTEDKRAAIDRAALAGTFPVTSLAMNLGDTVTPAARDSLIVRAAISHLVALDLITVADPEDFERFLPVEVPAPFDDDLRAKITEAQTEKRRILAWLHRGARP